MPHNSTKPYTNKDQTFHFNYFRHHHQPSRFPSNFHPIFMQSLALPVHFEVLLQRSSNIKLQYYSTIGTLCTFWPFIHQPSFPHPIHTQSLPHLVHFEHFVQIFSIHRLPHQILTQTALPLHSQTKSILSHSTTPFHTSLATLITPQISSSHTVPSLKLSSKFYRIYHVLAKSGNLTSHSNFHG